MSDSHLNHGSNRVHYATPCRHMVHGSWFMVLRIRSSILNDLMIRLYIYKYRCRQSELLYTHALKTEGYSYEYGYRTQCRVHCPIDLFILYFSYFHFNSLDPGRGTPGTVRCGTGIIS